MKDIHGHGENCCSSCFHFILINYTFFVATSWNWQAAGDSNKCESLRLKFGLALLQLIMNDVILLIYRFISVHIDDFIVFNFIDSYDLAWFSRLGITHRCQFSAFRRRTCGCLLPTNLCRTEALWEKRAWACKYLGWLGWASSWDVEIFASLRTQGLPGFIWTQHYKIMI